MQWRLNPATDQRRCPAGHRADCWWQIPHRDALISVLGVLSISLPHQSQTSYKAALTPSTTSRRLLRELQNSDDKSSQHYCRIREYGVLKCLTAVKRKKTFVGKKEIHNLCCKIEYSTLYFNSFSIYIYLKQRKDALFRSYMSALKITSCAKSKPSPVCLHNI